MKRQSIVWLGLSLVLVGMYACGMPQDRVTKGSGDDGAPLLRIGRQTKALTSLVPSTFLCGKMEDWNDRDYYETAGWARTERQAKEVCRANMNAGIEKKITCDTSRCFQPASCHPVSKANVHSGMNCVRRQKNGVWGFNCTCKARSGKWGCSSCDKACAENVSTAPELSGK